MTTQAFHILLALAGEDLHGYAIMREVDRLSGGQVKLGPGTLYGAVQRMLEDGWIEEIDGPAGEDASERRRYYRLTKPGRAELASEAERLRQLVKLAQSRKVLPARG